MTTTPPEAPPAGPGPGGPDEGPRVTRDEVRDLGRLRRSRTDRKVAGVAGGLARHLDIDPVILRVAFVVLVFFGGAGLILYAACWLLVPEEGSSTAPLHLDDRSRSVALVIAGVIALTALVGHSLGRFGFPWPLAVVALAAVLYLTRRDARRAEHSQAQGAPPPPPAPAYDAPQAEQGSQPGNQPGTQFLGGWQPSATAWQPPPVRSPRRRGPVLFWFTLALVALAEGVLGTVHLAGAPATSSAYPALALGIIGTMLLVGAFWGRAGGLILLGLVSAVALAITTAVDSWDGTTVRQTPTDAAQVRSDYRVPRGELVLDLTEVRNLHALDGRSIDVSGDVGRLEVVLPTGLAADVRADVNGPGNIRLFGDETGGIDIGMNSNLETGSDDPVIHLDAELAIGQIEVHQ